MMPMPQSPSQPPADDERTLALLLKAIDSLESAERTEVLMFLLRRGLGVGQPPELFTSVGSSVHLPGQGGIGRPQAPGASGLSGALGGPGRQAAAERLSTLVSTGFSFSRPTGEGQQTVPVRFSTDSHQRLRAWCAEHGFPMAAVVRGLVDQFLEAQA